MKPHDRTLSVFADLAKTARALSINFVWYGHADKPRSCNQLTSLGSPASGSATDERHKPRPEQHDCRRQGDCGQLAHLPYHYLPAGKFIRHSFLTLHDEMDGTVVGNAVLLKRLWGPRDPL